MELEAALRIRLASAGRKYLRLSQGASRVGRFQVILHDPWRCHVASAGQSMDIMT